MKGRKGSGSTDGRRKKLLYLYPRSAVFIQRDIELLSRHYHVVTHELLKGSDLLLPFRLIGQFIFLIRHAAWKYDAVCHFSGYHSLLPALLARRCFVILAGSDGACFPGFNYGNFRKSLYGKATGLSAKRATRLLPVDATLIDAHQTYDPASPVHQGIHAFVPDLYTPWTVVPYGFDVDHWKPVPGIDREEDLFVCVAGGAASGNAVHYRKGIDLILQCARDLPHARFTVVGSSRPHSYTDLPANVNVEGRMDPEGLRALFSKARYYMQVSVMEGFPNALCEAMLCNCIPITSSMAAMPSICGDVGFLCQRRDAKELGLVLAQALALPPSERETRSHAARERIASRFGEQERERSLLQILDAFSTC